MEQYSLQHFEFEDMQDSVAGRLRFTAHHNGFTCSLQYKISLDDTIILMVGGLNTDEMRRVISETEADLVHIHLDKDDVEILPLQFLSSEAVWSIGRTLNFYTGHNSEGDNQNNK